MDERDLFAVLQNNRPVHSLPGSPVDSRPDVMSITKASRIFTGEMVLDELLKNSRYLLVHGCTDAVQTQIFLMKSEQ